LRWRSSGSLKSEVQISPRKLRFEWSLEERGWELKRVSQSVYKLNWVANPVREAWGAFYSPPRESSHWVPETQTCLGRGPDMFDHHLWNLAKKLDKPGVTRDKAERPDMSRLGAGHVRVRSQEPG
jgi:hypothetical protein